MTYRSTRTLARRTAALGIAALAALVAQQGVASAADLLICTGTEHDLKAELAQALNDATNNGLTPLPAGAVNPNVAAGRLDDGSVQITNAVVSTIFPAGIPFIDADPITPGFQRWPQIFANVNGNITFRDRLAAYTPQAIPGLNQPTIAAYFGDVDLRNPEAEFTLCLEPANERLFLTWRNVGYYDTNNDLLNSFQIVLTNNDAQVCPASGNFEVEFRYEEDLEWTTGDADSNVDNGLGPPEATAGIDAGDTINAVALPGSGTAAVLDLDTVTNANEPGVHRFLVAEGTLPRCGNNVTNLCEQCDDGNANNNDGCTNLCLTAACGDGFRQPGETCDTTELAPGATCPDGFTGTPLCNNDPANPGGNDTCTLDAIPDGCTDADECALGTDTCDDPPAATCTNTEGSFTCACNPGFTGNGFVCTDVDECLDGTAGCDANATCTNTEGSFDCDCNEGFEGNGVTCTDIDECLDGSDNCDVNATCTNTVPGFDCDCNDGFTGNGVTCTPDGAGGAGPGAGGNGQGGTGNGGNGQGGTGNGQGGGEGPAGPAVTATSSTGSGSSTANGSSGVDNGSSGTANGSSGDGGSGDGLDGAIASGGACAVKTSGREGSKGGLALLALAGAVVVARRRRS